MKSRILYTSFLILIFLSLISSCKKTGAGASNGNGSTTEMTAPTPVTTRLGAYIINNDQNGNPIQLLSPSGSVNFNYQTANAGFFAGPTTVDKYLSTIEAWPMTPGNNPGFLQYKTYNVSSEFKNYINFKFLGFVNAGTVKNLGSGPTILPIPGNGTISFPAGSLNSLSIDQNDNIMTSYLDPTANEFAVGSPGLPFADDKAERFFLESYGIYEIMPVIAYCNCTIISSSDLFAKEATLQMPIPAALLASAPDSIEAWHLDANLFTWVKNGFAYKKNGFYEKNIRESGSWNFAKPRHAVYITLQLRTTNGMGIPNARYVIKNASGEIVEGRTDVEGNALALLPVNERLKFNIIDDHFNNYLNIQVPDIDLGSFSSSTTKKIELPDRTDIGTIEGTIYNCDGSQFGNGSVIISQQGAKDDYITPIVNGKFAIGNWLNTYYSLTKLYFLHAGGDTAFNVNTCLGSQYISHLKRLKENFYGCPNAPNLYCNYQVDGIWNTINGNTGQSTPTLTAKPSPGYTTITIQDGNKGISFLMWTPGGNDGEIMGLQPLSVNNQACKYGPDPELTIYRYDGTTGGIMEGWFNIDYVDPNNASHKMSGNFRIKFIN